MTRLAAVVASIALVAAACGGNDNADDAAAARGRSVEQADVSPRTDVPSALDNPLDPSFPAPLIDPADLRSGGPPPDGIPAIDDPRFLDTREVTYLEDDEPVLAIEVDGDARAYPIQIMTWHEIVNDTVGGIPVAVSYCPLCNTAPVPRRGSAWTRTAAIRPVAAYGRPSAVMAATSPSVRKQTTSCPTITTRRSTCSCEIS
jgi:hypothetical protein